MTRLNLLLAATTSTLLLTIGSARATETVTETDALIETLDTTSQIDQAVQIRGDEVNDEAIAADPTAEEVEITAIADPADQADQTDRNVAEEFEEFTETPVANESADHATLELELEPEAEFVPVDRTEDVLEPIASDSALQASESSESIISDPSDESAPLNAATALTPATTQTIPQTTIPDTIRLAPTLDEAIAQGDIKLQFSDNTPAPSYLNPRPNPLTFPTILEDVTIIGDQPISLNQAIELALRNNIDLQNSIVSVQRQQQTLRSAQAALWPQLDLTSNFTWSDSANARISIQRQLDLTGNRSVLQTDSDSTTWNTELRLRYNIFTAGSRDANITSAHERLRLLELEVERQTETTRLSVSEAYYDIQNADQQVVIAESAVGNSEESLADAQALERAGVGTQFDVLRSEVQLANDQQRLRQTQSDQRVARRTLARLLDLPPNLDVSAGDPIELAGTWDLPLEETILLAFRSRAELEQQLAQREISRQEQRVARAGTLPQLSAFAAVNLLDNSGDGVDGLTEGYTAGLQLSWQLFNGGSTSAAVRDQELAQQSAELEFANQRNQVRLQVEQAYYQLEASLQNVSTSEEALTLAEESLTLARLRFQAGVGTQTEVIDAQNDLTQAQGNRVTAIIGYNQALASLRRAVGNHPLVDEIDATF